MLWYDKLSDHIRQNPARSALVWLDSQHDEQRIVTYHMLDRAVTQAKNHLLDTGVAPGDRVALFLEKSPEFIYYHLAALRLGAISMPLNPAASNDELDYYLSDSQASTVVVDPQTEGKVRSPNYFQICDVRLRESKPGTSSVVPLDVNSNDTAIMIYTSGTTGRPKGAELTHQNLTVQVRALNIAWDWRPADRMLHALPLFHVHGLIVGLHAAIYAGAVTYLLPRFEPELVLQQLAINHCTIFMGVPTMYHRLTQHGPLHENNLNSLRLFTCGSDRLPDALLHTFQRTFGHVILERYGMSETGMLMSNPLIGERRAGSVGVPLPGVEARIVDPASGELLTDGQIGEIQVRGENIFKGYWRQPEQTRAAFTDDGWFRTGDLGMREPDGYFSLKGRAKDLIISGGFNVYPPEVERVLLAHPAVDACVVFGCPDAEWGERVTAVVKLAPDHSEEEDIKSKLLVHCREYLAAYKIPRSIHFVETLPRNAIGKVSRNILQAQYCVGGGT